MLQDIKIKKCKKHVRSRQNSVREMKQVQIRVNMGAETQPKYNMTQKDKLKRHS